MTQQVDSGRILEVRRFEIGETANLLEVLEMTHSALTQLAFDFITTLKSSKMEDLESLLLDSEISEKWGGKRRKISHLDELLAVPLDISKHELDVRIRALHHPSFPLRVDLHGYKFELRTDEI